MNKLYCLLCHNPIDQIISWEHLFLSSPVHPEICKICSSKLEEIYGEQCRICSRPFSKLPTEFQNKDICHDCYRWEQDVEWTGTLTRNISIFDYNDFLKELLAQFKFRGDHEIVKAFTTHVQSKFKQMFHQKSLPFIVPIPLSPERLYERGFNQANSLAQLLNVPIDNILTRIHTEKQSKKTRQERIHKQSPFHLIQLNDPQKYHNKPILLIDDIYTTGTTLRQAAKALTPLSPKAIYSLTLARS